MLSRRCTTLIVSALLVFAAASASAQVGIKLDDRSGDWQLDLYIDFEDGTVGERSEQIGYEGNTEEDGASVRVTDEQALSGQQSLKVTETLTTENRLPRFKNDITRTTRKVLLAFSFMREEHAGFRVRFQHGTPYPVDVWVTRDGELLDREGGTPFPIYIPAGEWVQLQLEYEVRSENFNLTVKTEDGTVETFVGKATDDANQAAVNRVYWTSKGDRGAVFYLDDIVVYRQ